MALGNRRKEKKSFPLRKNHLRPSLSWNANKGWINSSYKKGKYKGYQRDTLEVETTKSGNLIGPSSLCQINLSLRKLISATLQ